VAVLATTTIRQRLLRTVLVLALIGVGIWAIVAANQTDDIDVATDLADEWIAGWNASDPEAIVAVFTEDGTYWIWGSVRSGRDEIRSNALYVGSITTNAARITELTSTEAGAFTFGIQWDVSARPWVSVVEIELDADLASRIDVLELTALE
jgi:hypothetical protein